MLRRPLVAPPEPKVHPSVRAITSSERRGEVTDALAAWSEWRWQASPVRSHPGPMPDDCCDRRLAISLTPSERDYLISLAAPSTTETAAVASTRDRLEGKSLAATAGTNFGRDTHEAALGSSVTSVKLSITEVAVLRSALSTSETPLRVSLGSKLELLHEALVAQSSPSGQSLATVAASVGLSAASEPPDVVPLTVLTGCLGAGKTTVIRSLIDQLPDGYTCAPTLGRVPHDRLNRALPPG